MIHSNNTDKDYTGGNLYTWHFLLNEVTSNLSWILSPYLKLLESQNSSHPYAIFVCYASSMFNSVIVFVFPLSPHNVTYS